MDSIFFMYKKDNIKQFCPPRKKKYFYPITTNKMDVKYIIFKKESLIFD